MCIRDRVCLVSLGVGNGEIALYWLYQFSESAKVDEGRESDDPDLFFNGQGVEVKSWGKHEGMHGLGRFGADKENLSLLSIIFGFNALATVFGEGEKVPKTINPTNFKGSDLVTAMEKVSEFKNIIDANETIAKHTQHLSLIHIPSPRDRTRSRMPSSA